MLESSIGRIEQPDELSALSEEEWRGYVEKYFSSNKDRILKFILWLLNNNKFYRDLLEIKNSQPENMAEDILQSIFVHMLGSSPKGRKTLLAAKESAVYNNLVRWGLNSYLSSNEIGAPIGHGENPHNQDVYKHPDAKIVPPYNPDEQGAEDSIKLTHRRDEQLLSTEISPEKLNENKELVQITDDILTKLPSKKIEKAVRMKYGLSPYEREHTNEEIGQEFGLTGETARQILAKAMHKLRHPSRSNKLRQFIE